jgi:hypothetical protein
LECFVTYGTFKSGQLTSLIDWNPPYPFWIGHTNLETLQI